MLRTLRSSNMIPSVQRSRLSAADAEFPRSRDSARNPRPARGFQDRRRDV